MLLVFQFLRSFLYADTNGSDPLDFYIFYIGRAEKFKNLKKKKKLTIAQSKKMEKPCTVGNFKKCKFRSL